MLNIKDQNVHHLELRGDLARYIDTLPNGQIYFGALFGRS